MTTLPIQIASRSEVGGRSRNEDHVLHGEVPGGWYALLADGAGGHSDGAVASELVVRAAAHELGERAAGSTLLPDALADLIRNAHAALNERQRGAMGRQRMHATLVALWIDRAQQHAIWSHAGDSRLYLLRRGRIAQVTHDDSVVQGMVDAGLLDAAQARIHPQRNQLLAALGSEEPIEPHCCDAPLALQDGDAFLLCSDGWHDPLDDADIEGGLAEARSADAWLAAMQRRLLARERAHQDNFSAIAVWVGDPAEVTRIRAD
ncbi:MAG TPA: protein phosphatase 2C domain-containing protein [Albitalea sp.]